MILGFVVELLGAPYINPAHARELEISVLIFQISTYVSSMESGINMRFSNPYVKCQKMRLPK